VAIGADFDFEHVAFDGRASGEIVAAGAMDCYGVIVGMNTRFHEAPFVRVRSARPASLGEKGLAPKGESYSRVARSRCKPHYTGKPVIFPNSVKIRP
jgi:hypothetical protein